MKKYELIKETETCYKRRIVYRIRALKDFSDIKAGDVGGWVCSENNLSQEGDCWIYDEARCLDDARVYDNAMMFDNAIMFGNSVMYDNAVMLNNSIMYDNSKMFNKAKMYDNAIMCNNARVYDNAKMYDNAIMYDNAEMYNNAIMFGNAKMYDNAIMYDNAEMYDEARMWNNAVMFDNSKMYNKARMFNNAILDKNKILYGSINKSYKKIFQYYCENKLITAILTEENEILYSVGRKIGITKEKLIDRIYNDCEVRGKGLEEYPHRQEYLDMIDIAESYLKKFI